MNYERMGGLADRRFDGPWDVGLANRPTADPPVRLAHHRSLALRRRWRLVRQSLEPAESPRGPAHAHHAARGGSRARGDADRARAVGSPLHLYDGDRKSTR